VRITNLVFCLSFVVAAAAFGQTAQSSAQTKRPMTFEDMMHMKRLGMTAVSPDGKWLGYSVMTVDLDANTKTSELWIQPIAGSDPHKLEVGLPGDDGIQFSPDGHSVLFLSGREMAAQHVYIADFDSATGITSNPRRVGGIWGGEDNAQWSPDSQSIAFTAEVYPDCPPIVVNDFPPGDNCNMDRDVALRDSKVKAQIFTHLLYRHWNHYTGDKRSHIFLAAAFNGFVRDLTPNNPHDVPPFSLSISGGQFSFSPDSKELAFTENPDPEPAISTSAQIYTLDITNPAAKPVKVSTSAGGNFSPAYSPDGKYLAWRSEARAGYEADKFRLMLYDRAAKTTKDLVPKFDNWVDEFAWGPDSKVIYFSAGSQGESPIYSVGVYSPGVGLRGHEIGIGTNQYSEPGEFSALLVSFDGNRLIATRQGVNSPGEVVLFHDLDQLVAFTQSCDPVVGAKNVHCPSPPAAYRDASGPVPLTHLNDALLSQLDLPKMEPFWFTAKDGTKLQGFVIRPPGFDPAKKYPLKFLIHGGPQGAWGDMWSYRWNAELFAANGYVVVMINPRGSTGYGQAIVDGVNGDWGGKPYTDLMTGLDYAEQHYPFIDKSRECALGASYGGYMANWVLGHTDRFKCIVSHDGMFDAESAFGTTEEDWFNIWEFKGHPWDYYGKPDAENPFRKWSPSLYAKNFKTPTLVVHGQLDYRLDVSEGFQLFDTLQLLHVPSKMLYFPDEGHWVLKPQNSRLWWKTVNDWVDEWTKPK
jgi:dipeptidyl aminopeptidase/acylaminoacyl peptidase